MCTLRHSQDGHTYDRSSIEQWFAQGKRTSPNTGKLLASLKLLPNLAVKKALEEAAHVFVDSKESESQLRDLSLASKLREQELKEHNGTLGRSVDADGVEPAAKRRRFDPQTLAEKDALLRGFRLNLAAAKKNNAFAAMQVRVVVNRRLTGFRVQVGRCYDLGLGVEKSAAQVGI